MRRMSFVLIGLVILVLAGCGQRTETAPPAAGTDQQAPAVQETGDRNPTAAELNREETTDLVLMVEGMEETVPATLYIGQGYSIYIPDEGWRMEKDTEDGVPEDIWESTVNDDVELRVLHLGEKTLEQAQAWVTAEENDYQLIEDKQGGLGGTDAEDREMLEVRFYPSGSQMYAVLYQYPMEAAEGFGARLSVMADTFETMS